MVKKLSKLWNRFLEWSFQRTANKQFAKHVKDGDNT